MKHGIPGNIYWLAFILLTLLAPAAASGQILYVDDSAPAGGDGKTWNTAFQDLGDGV